MGMIVKAGPSAATTTVSARRARTTPVNVERQPRVTPTARTIVSASTISTEDARKDAATRKIPLVPINWILRLPPTSRILNYSRP
jgi:hypothetical protein